MATEAVPQATLDPQLDADLINYDADEQWSFPDHGADSAQVTDAKTDAADALSHQPEMAGDTLNEIDWEDHPQPGNDEPPSVPTELGTEESEL
ncbi:hypothetical protein IMZ48_19765, partial [Candidatus Bathyarchaeota archaeon]|nr:hypothetical protein [Candidatus Bathyarchaeota archaeon]